jgi:O-antigen/teichoic acid export membrane protein
VIRASGDFYLSVWIGFGLLLLMVVGSLILVPKYGPMGAASSLILTIGSGTIVTSFLVYRRFGPFLMPPVLIKVTAATALMVTLGTQISVIGPLLLLKFSGLLGFYVFVLAILGELRHEDLQPLVFWR